MPMTIRPSDRELLDGLHEWTARGRQAILFAQQRGLRSSHISALIQRFGLRMVRAEGLVCIRTGLFWPELLTLGYIVPREEPEKKAVAK